jgi:two-component system sensor histidine kinase DesK
VTIPPRWLWAGRAAIVAAGLLVALASTPEIVGSQETPPTRVAVVVVLLAFAGVWTGFWLSALTVSSRTSALAVALLAGLLGVLTAAAPSGRDGLVLAALAAGAGLPRRWAGPGVVVIALAATLLQILHGSAAPGALFTFVNDGVTGGAGIGGRLLVDTNAQLLAAREEIARLAVAEERLRFARDLHDLIGQNLTVAVLKTDLAARSLPVEARDGVRDELRDAAALTRRSLDDIRAVVAGYRQPGLAAELAQAEAALRAAGIELSVEDGLGPVPDTVEAVLAWTVREGATNMLRHSRASHGRVRLGRRDGSVVLEVEDDGRGLAPGLPGSGLSGIAERAAALGGSVETSKSATGGFKLVLSLPLAQP